MNCLILVLLLLSCQGGGCGDCGLGRRNMNGRDGGCPGRRDSDRERENGGRDCDRDRDRTPDCGCRNESRVESRSFIPYPGSSCGCDEPRNNSGCDCND